MKTIDVRPGEIVLGSKTGWPAWEWIPLKRTHDDRWLTWDWSEAEWDEWAYEPDFVAPLPAAEPEPVAAGDAGGCAGGGGAAAGEGPGL